MRNAFAHFLFAIMFVAPLQAVAQGAIPQPVIDQCNAANKAGDLPECLKEGAIAFEMLDLARSAAFYAAGADPVIDLCASRNETFLGAWVCFDEAAGKAVETRELIGVENIADACVAAISDPAIHQRLEAAYTAKRAERFPDEMFSGINSFYPFQGCADQ